MQANCDFQSDIVISGISGRFPKSNNLDEFWQNLINGIDMVDDKTDRYNSEEVGIPSRLAVVPNLDKFDAEFFHVHAKQSEVMDPRMRLLLETTYEAIIDAGVHPDELRGSKTGVFVGLCDNGAKAIAARIRTYERINKYASLGSAESMLANRLSFNFDLQGPSQVVDTACSSGFVALHQALQAIRTGNCDTAIVASATTHHDPFTSYCFHGLQMTSADGKCKSFDASADGYVRAEASVAMYICKKQVAKRTYGTLVHTAINNDGYKEHGITYPSEIHQKIVMKQVYEDTGISPLDVDYIEAHGTGTKVGDPQELMAIANIFCHGRDRPLPVGSVKSNMGHTEPVSGLCSIAKVIMANFAGVLPANLHYNAPNPDVPALFDGSVTIVDKIQPFNAKYVGINSMGFGGTNVHLLLKLDDKEEANDWSPSTPVLLVASGRTKEGVELFLEKTHQRCKDHSFVRLTHEICKYDTHLHPYRGYAIVDSESININVEERDSGRQVWFIVTGLGSQWPGMGRDLVKFPVFQRSVKKSAEVLLTHGFDLISLLQCGDPSKFDDFKNSLSSITPIQIALIDLLKSIGIQPDGIVGHSNGEIAAAYADGCVTDEQAVLTSFVKARAILESNLKPGTVASVGLSWDEAGRRCPPDVWPVIHNAEQNVTIAGTPDAVAKLTKQLESESVFVKMVRSANFGFHSPLIKDAGKMMTDLTLEIIPDPKLRSKKWLSTSVPESQWGTDMDKYCSAEYFVRNSLQAVYFHPTIKHVPEHVVALEIGPHCFFQSILKTSLPKSAINVGLIHVKSPDNCTYFMDSIGKCFLAGINVDVAALFDHVKFPVPATTPNISSLIRWDHSEIRPFPHHTMVAFPVYESNIYIKATHFQNLQQLIVKIVVFQELSRRKGVPFMFNLSFEQDTFLKGHKIDGKVLFPATGYIWLAWRCFAKQNGCKYEELPVVFENVRFERMTLLNNVEDTTLLVNIFTSGKFEITESDNVVCSGVVRNVESEPEREMLRYEIADEVAVSGPSMNKDEFYTEMHLRKYEHSGLFQGIEEVHMGAKWARVKWHGQWVCFMDAMLQAFLLGNEDRDMYVPVRIMKLTIEPSKVMEHLQANESMMIIKSWEDQKTGTCPGVEFRGLRFTKFNQKFRNLKQATMQQLFLPYLKCSQVLTETEAFEASMEIAMDNILGSKFICTEILKDPENMIAHRIANESGLKFASSEFFIVNTSDEPLDDINIKKSMSKIVVMEDLNTVEQNLLFVDDEYLFHKNMNLINVGGFILFKGPSGSAFPDIEFSVISKKAFLTKDNSNYSYYLLKKLQPVPQKIQVVDVDAEGYLWVEAAKNALRSLADIDKIYFASQNPRSGIQGFFKCLVKEYSSEKLRCFHAIDTLKLDFNQPAEILRSQIQNDLLHNIYKQNAWGVTSNLVIQKEEFRKKKQSSIAFANALTLGDLSTLTWVDSPLKIESKELIHVQYSSLNFKDIMLATGKLVQDATIDNLENPECVLGMEFSGFFRGKRVFGVGQSSCLATVIDPTGTKIFDIPDNWSFEEAATIPCVYITVYLALILKGKMKKGESILIHAGSGGVGQAAIQVALSMNCQVFTTVSTEKKRQFLKSRFPTLTDDCFSNSRDAGEFEYHINKFTKGRGVDLVLNCLAQDKLYASIRCLAINGRFLEIGKFDMFNDSSIGMSILAKSVSVIGILADQVFAKGGFDEMDGLRDFIKNGITAGMIKPLSNHVFEHNQLEEAFRFMAQGKHIGKVVIHVGSTSDTPTTVDVHPRTYMDPNKVYIVIGGLGGMGFELANWLVERGVKKLILSSRSGRTTNYHEYHIGIWNRRGVKALLDSSDVSLIEGAKSLLEHANTIGPIGGIFNVAVVLKDALFDNQTPADFVDVVKCKADASQHLDTLSRELAPQLDHFVVFSSIVVARGNPGQTNYGFANSVMERICEERKNQGLPGLAVQWGAVGDVGVFHRKMKDKVILGLAPQSIKSCLETLDLFLQQDKAVVCSFIPSYRSRIAAGDSSESLVAKVANILGIKDIKRINPKTPLADLGMDSLMAAELTNVLSARSNVQIAVKDLPTLTFEKLAEIDSQGKDNEAKTIFGNDNGKKRSKVLTLKSMPEITLSEMKSLKKSENTIIAVHPIDGTVESLQDLVLNLDANVYGLECSKEAPLDSIEKLAEFYISKIREIQAEGPYKLCGYSFGANVAFEIALQLESQNETVALLLLLDGSPRFKQYLGSEKETLTEELIIFGFLSQYISPISLEIYQELKDCKTEEARHNVIAKALHNSNTNLGLAEIKELFSAFAARIKCGMDYNPKGKVKAKTVLVKSVEQKWRQNVEFDYGLSDVCENVVEVIEVQGNHYCFYEKPDELGLAGVLNKIIV